MFSVHNLSLRRPSRSGFSLIEILVVTVLLIMLSGGLAYFYLGSGGKTKDGKTKRTPITVAKDTVCQSNIGQVRQSLNVLRAGDPDGALPQSLTELKLPSELLYCAVGKEPYQYDPSTGMVRCVHPGHENF